MIKHLRRRRNQQLQPLIQAQRDFYSRSWTPGDVRDWQLDQFNRQWSDVRSQVPYFSRLARDRNLPAEFASWRQFRELMPMLDRPTVQECSAQLSNATRSYDYLRTTGGSTAEPVQLPSWTSENDYSDRDMWYARSWFGVSPADKLFMIWGHSHLLGSGFRGWLNGIQRQAKDALLGYYRYSAYDLSEPDLRQAGQAMLDFKPAYIIAYAVALDRFARVNAHRRHEFHKLDLKVAIATAEAFPQPDSADTISDILGCPVAMEYGAVETGPIAHQRSDGRFTVFWRHYHLEGEPSAAVPGAYEILVTTLYPRCTPLIRYRIGDLISADPNAADFDQTFDTVIGRCNDYIVLPGGDVVHSEAFAHAAKESPAVSNFQVIQAPDGHITFSYIGHAPADSPALDEVRRRLRRINPQLADVEIEQVDTLQQTIAGKTQRVVRRL